MNTHPTKIALALMALGGFSAQASANLVITEYIEGAKGNNKAVEISNMGNVAVDLEAEGYSLNKYTNGQGNLTSEPLSGVIQPGQSFVYVNSGADLFDPSKWISLNRIVSFNGDDPIVLMKGDAVVDRVGQYGPDPGEGWEVPGTDFSTANKTLRRQSTITVGDADLEGEFPANVNDWAVFDPSVVDGLGCPGVDACGATKEGGLLITEYVEDGGTKVVELSNLSGSEIDLTAENYRIVLYTNGNTTAGNTQTLEGTLAAKKSLVFYNSGSKDEFKQIGQPSSVTNFNGNDALVLYKGDEVIDSFGQLGNDPGKGWKDPNDPAFNTENVVLRRKASVTIGDAVSDDAFPGTINQWVVFPKTTSDGIGCPGEGACDSTPPGPDPDPDVPCSNCENLDKVADATQYNFDAYYTDVLTADLNTPSEWKAALSAVAQNGHKPLSYKGVWTVLTYSDEDPKNSKNVIELYSGKSISKYDNGGNTGDWNREHVWPKSHGFPGESQWGYTDAHHLRPTDVGVNNARAAFDFNDISGAEGTSEVNGAPGNYINATLNSFEPRDEVKGDVARMMFYMDTRYEMGGNGSMPDLVLVDKTGTDASKHEAGKLCALYQWHLQDPVGEADRQRNNAVYEYQGNRNPYIDNPDWVQQVYGAACDDAPVPELDVTFVVEGPTTVTETVSFTLDASKTVAANEKPLTFEWKQISGPTLTMTPDGAVLTAVSLPLERDETVELELMATDGEFSATHTVILTVEDKPLAVDIQFEGETSVIEGDAVAIKATPAQTEAGDDIQYTWRQVSGEPVEFATEGSALNFTAPDVALDSELVFVVGASDGNHSTEKSVTVTVKNQVGPGWVEPEGGAMGALLALLVPLAFWRRRQR